MHVHDVLLFIIFVKIVIALKCTFKRYILQRKQKETRHPSATCSSAAHSAELSVT